MFDTAQKVIKLRGCVSRKFIHCSIIPLQNIIIPIGFQGFYDGFGAAAMRQMICTSMRFSLYEVGKDLGLMEDNLIAKVILASLAGASSSIIGIPLDVINIRMQNDMKGKEELRRKYYLHISLLILCFHLCLSFFLCRYRHVGDALIRIPREEGWRGLYNGASAAVVKAAVGTIGQIAVYDQVCSIRYTAIDNN